MSQMLLQLSSRAPTNMASQKAKLEWFPISTLTSAKPKQTHHKARILKVLVFSVSATLIYFLHSWSERGTISVDRPKHPLFGKVAEEAFLLVHHQSADLLLFP